MAVSSSISGYEHTVDVSNNTSYVHVDFTVTTGSKTYNNEGSAYYRIYCNGQNTGKVYFTIGKGKTKTFSADFGPFTHNADGSYGPVSISGNVDLNVSSGTSSSSGNVAMTTIPRASSFSFSGTTLGSGTTVSISRASGSFTHCVKYVMGGITQNYTDVGTSITFTRPYSDANQFSSNSASGTGSITVITYNGGTEIGRTSKNIIMTLPDNSDTKPVENTTTTITEAIAGIYEKFGAFIQNESRALFTFDYSGRYGATISEYSVTINDKISYGSSATITSNILDVSGSVPYTCKIKDSRGRITTETGIISVTQYSNPVLTMNVERDENQNANVNLQGQITSIGNLNDKSLVVKYKTRSSSTYQTVNVPISSYTIDESITIPISEYNSYDLYASVSDYFSTYNTSVEYLSTSFDLLHFRSDGLGIGIGKKAEYDALDIGMDIYYKGEPFDDYIKGIFDDYDEEEF